MNIKDKALLDSKNILIVGSAGAGKTTVMEDNLVDLQPDERISVEDVHEVTVSV